MKGKNLLAIFAISALLVSISATNFVYADDSSDNEERKEKMANDKQLKKDQKKRT